MLIIKLPNVGMILGIPSEFVQMRRCVVCGEEDGSYHFGAISCHGCKAFFRRTIRKNLSYRCNTGGNCEVSGARRSECRSCRYEKCLKAGMKASGVQAMRQKKLSARANRVQAFVDESTNCDRDRYSPNIDNMSDSDVVELCDEEVVAVSSSNNNNTNITETNFSEIYSAALQVTADDFQPITDGDNIPMPFFIKSASTNQNLVRDQSRFGFSVTCAFMDIDSDYVVETATAPMFNYESSVQYLLAFENMVDARLKATAIANNVACGCGSTAIYSSHNHNHLMCQELETRILFLKELGIFSTLPLRDQVSLVRNGCFDVKALSDIRRSLNETNALILFDGKHRLVRDAVAGKQGFQHINKVFSVLFTGYHDLAIDWVEHCCLCAILFWDPNVCDNDFKQLVRSRQTVFLATLEEYERCITTKGPCRYASLIMYLHTFKGITCDTKNAIFCSQALGAVERQPLIADVLRDPSAPEKGYISHHVIGSV